MQKGDVSRIDWYGQDVLIWVDNEVSPVLVMDIAYQLEGRIKVNIVNNDQVDTGFMLNSVYVSASNEDNYGDTWSTGTYKSRKTGRMVDEVRGPKITPPDDKTVVVAIGAGYAIYQERKNSFALAAVQWMQGKRTEVTVEAVAREEGWRK